MKDSMEEDTFIAEDVEQIIKSAIEMNLKDFQYNSKKVSDWSNQVIDAVLKGLHNMEKPFKYIVTCIIMQKNGAGLHTAAACYWDTAKDDFCKVPWENQTMHCICTVYGLAMRPSVPEDSQY